VSYSIGFTPRRPRSIWSTVNIKRIDDLTRQGLMRPAGIQAFEAREEARSNIYSFEQKDIQFEPDQERRFRASPTAWKFFSRNGLLPLPVANRNDARATAPRSLPS